MLLSFSQESQASELLGNVEIVPVQQYMLVERPTMRRYPIQSLAESLPAERWYETDGVAPGSMKDVGNDENPAGSRCPVRIPPTSFPQRKYACLCHPVCLASVCLSVLSALRLSLALALSSVWLSSFLGILGPIDSRRIGRGARAGRRRVGGVPVRARAPLPTPPTLPYLRAAMARALFISL
jgi:hypothetical protein